MACFIVPAVEAVVTTALTKHIEKNEKEETQVETGIPFSRKLKWLNNMLWGGSALLAFEHVWHGELVPWFPFLTNASSPESAAQMLTEMAMAGVGMAMLVTAVWFGIVATVHSLEKRENAVETVKQKA